MNRLKEINGRHYVDAKVIILPTEKDSLLYIENETLYCNLSNVYNKNSTKRQNYFMYIVCKEEIKEGEWYLSKALGEPKPLLHTKKGENFLKNKGFKVDKIIATTNRNINEPDSNLKDITYALFPEPSKEFIKSYVEAHNNSEYIFHVLVEVEYFENPAFELIDANGDGFKLKIKKDNTINIRRAGGDWDNIVHLFREKHKICDWTIEHFRNFLIKNYDIPTEKVVSKLIN